MRNIDAGDYLCNPVYHVRMMSGDAYVVGIDAGGTTVRVAIGDSAGQVIAQGSVPAGDDSAAAAGEALNAVLGPLPERPVRSLCAGVARITRDAVKADWNRFLTDRFPAAVVELAPDYVVAFQGATDGVGVAVISGTGSVAYGENGHGGAERVGGRGWEFGDEGSGGWLTTEILRKTVRACDGLAPRVPLTDAVMEALGTDDVAVLGEEARRRLQTEGRGFLVPLARERAENGDVDAANLFAGAAGWLALLARITARRLGMENGVFRLATAGGMWEAGELIHAPFEKVVSRWMPGANIIAPQASPVHGALSRAVRNAATGRR